MTVVPHHIPDEETEQFLQYLLKHGEMRVTDLGSVFGYTGPEVVSRCSKDLRLNCDFRPDQKYWVVPVPDHNDIV